MNTQEIWKAIPGYEGFYEVSDHGRVKSMERVITDVLGRKRIVKERILRPGRDKDGYLRVVLRKDNSPRDFSIAPLVASVYIGHRPDGLECCHNDGDRESNHFLNLRWDTHKNNNDDKLQHGTKLIGEQCPSSKLKVSDIPLIRGMRADGWSYNGIAKHFNVCKRTIVQICLGRSWKHIP